jgi:hypothetical protein
LNLQIYCAFFFEMKRVSIAVKFKHVTFCFLLSFSFFILLKLQMSSKLLNRLHSTSIFEKTYQWIKAAHGPKSPKIHFQLR